MADSVLTVQKIREGASLRKLVGPAYIPNAFIVNVRRPSERVSFVSMPSAISHGFSAEWESTPAPGLVEPIRVFKHTNATTLSFSLQFYAQNDPGVDVVDKVDFLRRFTVSTTAVTQRNGNDVSTELPPPLALLLIGDLIQEFVIIKTVDVQWMEPYSVQLLYPFLAEVALSMEVVKQATDEALSSIGVPLSELNGNLTPLRRSIQ